MDNFLSVSAGDYTQGMGLGQSAQILKPGLYIVATPLGNLRDISLRALDVLQAAHVIYCEDTRVTQKLLQAYGLSKQLIRCDANLEATRAQDIAQYVAQGQIVALVSDAGTPCISDPGAQLVKACHDAQVAVIPIPGPSAVITALSVAGLLSGSFVFLGFLPTRSAARRQLLQKWAAMQTSLVVYEAPQRVAELLEDIAAQYGQVPVIIAREVTKKFETFYHGTPETLQEAIQDKNFKGEIVVIITPPDQVMDSVQDDLKVQAQLKQALQKYSLRQAVAHVTAQTGLPRKQVYALALGLSAHESED